MNKLFCLRNNFIINDLFYNRINLYFRNYLKQWYFQTVFLRNEKIKKFKQKNKLQKIFIKEFKKDKKYYGKILLKKLKLYNIKYFEFYIKSICFLKMILYITQGYLKKYKMLFFSHIFNNNENNLNVYKKLLFKKLITKGMNSESKKKIQFLLKEIKEKDYLEEYENYKKSLNEITKLYPLLIKYKLFNKQLYRNFIKWYITTIKINVNNKIDLKEDYSGKLINLRLLQLIIYVKKFLQFYFRFFIYQIKRKINSKPLTIIDLEVLENLNLDKISQGFYKINHIKGNLNQKIFESSDLNKKKICFSIWKNNKTKIHVDTYKINNNKENFKDIIKGYEKLFTIFQIRIYKYFCLFFTLIKSKYVKNESIYRFIIGLNIINNIFIKLKIKKNYQFINCLQTYLNSKLIIENCPNNIENSIKNKQKENSFISIYTSLNIIKKIIYNYALYKSFNTLKSFIPNSLNDINSDILRHSKVPKHQDSIKKKIYKNISSIILSMDKEINIKHNKLKIYNFLVKKILDKERIKKIKHNNLNYYLSKWNNERTLMLEKIKEDKDFQNDLNLKINEYLEGIKFLENKLNKIVLSVEKCDKCSKILKSSNSLVNSHYNDNKNETKTEKNNDDDLDDMDLLDDEMEDDEIYISYLEKTEKDLKNNIELLKKEKEEEQINLQNEVESLIKELENFNN